MEKYIKYFEFIGTSSRSEYWAINLISYLVFLPILLIVGFIVSVGGFTGVIVGLLLIFLGGIAITWLALAVTVRRCRDAGLNPWFTLTVLLPYIAVIPIIIFGCIPKKETNDREKN